MNLNKTIISEGHSFEVVEHYCNLRDKSNPIFQIVTEIKNEEGEVVKTMVTNETGEEAQNLHGCNK